MVWDAYLNSAFSHRFCPGARAWRMPTLCFMLGR